MISLCSPSDSALFTAKMPATASHSYFLGSPIVLLRHKPLWPYVSSAWSAAAWAARQASDDSGDEPSAILALVPDRPHIELILLDAKRGFGLGKLDVSLPELLIAPVLDVRAQQIGAFRERRPIVE